MALAEKFTHVLEGQSRLVAQFKDDLGLLGMLEAYLTQVQELEYVFFRLLDIVVDSTNQTGAQLDLIGRIVGENRNGKTDENYLRAIQARIVINRASGLPDEVLRVLALTYPDNARELTEHFPASIVASLSDTFTGDIEALADLIRQVRAAGVRQDLEYTVAEDTETFSFASGDTAETDSSAGFANDAGTTGGKFADVVEA